MPVVRLGVLDFPYAEDGKTTGDVAEILEEKYGVFTHFWEVHGPAIVESIAEVQSSAIEAAVASEDPAASTAELRTGYLGVSEEAKALFTTFLTMKELDGLAEGVPTKASLEGVSHRFKNKKGAPGRPSLVDTGTFLASMGVEIE